MIKIIAVGKIKNEQYKIEINNYLKQINYKYEIIEIKDEKDISGLKIEGRKILDKIKENDYVILLYIKGEMIDSIEMSAMIEDLLLTNKEIVFIIGGSYGVSDEVVKRANYKLSFSKFTMPHQLMRVILTEQIFRSFMIMKNHPYHK